MNRLFIKNDSKLISSTLKHCFSFLFYYNKVGKNSLLFLLFSFLLVSCSFHRKVAGKKSKSLDTDTVVNKNRDTTAGRNIAIKSTTSTITAITKTDTITENNPLVKMLTPIWQNRISYTTFAGKARIHYEGKDNNQEFTANFRIKKDSAIWIAVTAMGGMVQAARVLVTVDSFFMINYLEKEVISAPLTQIAKILPSEVDYTALQNLILGEPLRNGTITDANSTIGTWSIDVIDKKYMQQITYNKIDSTMLTGQIKTINPNGPKALMEYGDYELDEDKKIATKRVMNIENGNDIYSIDMKFLNISFNQPLEFPFTIPKNYSKK